MARYGEQLRQYFGKPLARTREYVAIIRQALDLYRQLRRGELRRA